MFYDFHNHTNYSHDSKSDINDLCRSAISKNISGILISDHYNGLDCNTRNFKEIITNSITAAKKAKRDFQNSLDVFTGVEIAEYFLNTSLTDEILHLTQYDAVIGSVHAINFEGAQQDYYSHPDFSLWEEKLILAHLNAYFDNLLIVSEKCDFDILAHLDCPLRYINGKYNRKISLEPFFDKIEKILKVIISREKSLEINTSGINTPFDSFMPQAQILKMYLSLGGTLITAGSDSHCPEGVGNGFDRLSSLLSSLGVSQCCRYEKRKPIIYNY
ncbi:MAG: histidinol-phosphatase HisJ family protein [Clostridia bacterium]|nr:histidinol-phosphatase HisJ family protein [Clostridia bacterium]